MKEGQKKTIVVTGAAGYLGRSMVRVLEQSGYRAVSLDNFSTSSRSMCAGFDIVEVDLTDLAALNQVWKKLGPVHGVIHFAARALVPESCESPDLYFRNNLLCTMNIARQCLEAGVSSLIHSSSCAVYGIPQAVPITEQTPLAPISPYGETKRAAEEILRHTALHKPLKVINLRYFNPAGSLNNGEWGENHEPETHLMPNVVKAILNKGTVSIFGEDYDTPDGTCIRDFIHVEDLMLAHLAALTHLFDQPKPLSLAINVGSGSGYSVREVIQTAEKVLQISPNVQVMPRRPGDPPKLVADITLARKTLHWEPKRSLEEMVRSHLLWEKKRPRL